MILKRIGRIVIICLIGFLVINLIPLKKDSQESPSYSFSKVEIKRATRKEILSNEGYPITFSRVNNTLIVVKMKSGELIVQIYQKKAE